MNVDYREYSRVLEEEGKKYGWGCILVTPEQFKQFLKLTSPRVHLDVGCHKGLLRGFVEKHSDAEYIGLDVWHYNAKISVLASGDLLPFRPNSIDTISFIESLEHIPDYPSALRMAYRVARKGVFIQSVICYDKCALLDRTHYHVLHPETLERLLKLIGFREVKHGLKKATFWLYALK
ncbi:MAG: hypothetical protein DRJ67_05150 [Thermoprotei archaeon]|nr:MAG: hypothetical protein DRJ67_05150 [Thermoprotei archaeon]